MSIVEFPKGEDEPSRKLLDLLQRRANQSRAEWLLYLDDDAKRFELEPAKLKELIEAVLAEREKKARDELEADRVRAKRQREERQEAEKKEKKERREDSEERQKRAKRLREFEKIKKLPRTAHEPSLVELAKLLGEDLELLRDEFAAYVDDSPERDAKSDVEPWPERVDGAKVLKDVVAMIKRFVVFTDKDDALVVVLWVLFAWCHDYATHSPILTLSGPEPDSGKTTLCGVLQHLAPHAYAGAEITGPGVYRLVDYLHPTLIVDDADKLVERKLDLMHVLNASWTRGTKIPRGGVWYDPFCPKILAGVDIRLPKTTASRTIGIVLWPKLESEKIENFGYDDTPEFLALRRQLSRWSADNASKLAAAKPAMPPGFINRIGANWCFLFAIADAAGVGKKVRAAAVKFLARRQKKSSSEGVRLLTAFAKIFETRKAVPSKEAVDLLTADKDGEWAEFRGSRRPISMKEVSLLLAPYEIEPDVVSPPRPAKPYRGYKAEWFEKAFERFLPNWKPKKPKRKRT